MSSLPILQDRLCYYQDQIINLESKIQLLSSKADWIGRFRLAVFVLTILLVYWVWSTHWIWPLTIILLGTSIFLLLIKNSKQTASGLRIQQSLLAINREEEFSLKGQYHDKPDGSEFIETWSLDNDLDRFGKNSLYQFINRAESQQGCETMAKSLIEVWDMDHILSCQNAAKELVTWVEWRQLFRVYSLQNRITFQSQEILRHWVTTSKQAVLPPVWFILVYLLPVLSISMTIAYAIDLVPRIWFYSFLIFAFALAIYFGKIAGWWFKHLSRITGELEALLPCIKMIEETKFVSAFLQNLQLRVNKPDKVSVSLLKLRHVLARYEYRLNPVVYIPLNFFLWWDLRQVLSLNQWRLKHNSDTDDWFEVIGKMEYICSYANLAFNRPSWIFPDLSDRWHAFTATGLSHPLLSLQKAVTNEFSLIDPNRIALITGSNMAGKSTFLRSIGANILIAMAGGPVFASRCTLCPSKILTSMRISDNLQEETSTFYAELKKIKIILDALKQGERVIILIDEMLRGTNTIDRQQGSRALIRQLIHHQAVAFIASHDTGLTEIQSQYPEVVRNYYFDSILEHDDIRFDYKIKDGVCTQANASYLMKKMGIEMD